MAMKQEILAAVARNLQEFGYPDATAENVATTKLFAMFGRDQVEGFAEKHGGNEEVQAATRSILEQMDATIAAG